MTRSLIFVPAKEKMLSKISNMDADACIIDLEDSIEAFDKEAALDRVKMFLQNADIKQEIYVRLNAERFSEEATVLSEFEQIGFMLPKFENPEFYNECISVWKNHKVIALVETPLGIVNINLISSCEWVDAVAFGAEDYTCKVNMLNSTETLRYQRSCLVTYCKAYGKPVYDTPSFKINDEEAFRAEVDSAADIGFDGKLLIHPKHISYINDVFGGADVDALKEIVRQYEESGKAVLVIGGEVYEKMHIDRMKKIIKENGGNEL